MAGTVGQQWRWDADPYGTTQPNSNPGGLGVFTYNLRYPGQYYDAESALSYNYFRDYDPQVGRYTESDPIGLDEDYSSTYAYVNGDPIDLIDPEGLYGVKPKVPLPSPALDSLLHCMEAILGVKLTVTSTTDGSHQDPGHHAGTSIDIRPPNTAQVTDVFCAAGNCGAAWGLDESKGAQKFKYTTGANLHLQLNPPRHPRPGAPNGIPARCKPGVCSK
jgi:RHS repeat-associated protein